MKTFIQYLLERRDKDAEQLKRLGIGHGITVSKTPVHNYDFDYEHGVDDGSTRIEDDEDTGIPTDRDHSTGFDYDDYDNWGEEVPEAPQWNPPGVIYTNQPMPTPPPDHPGYAAWQQGEKTADDLDSRWRQHDANLKRAVARKNIAYHFLTTLRELSRKTGNNTFYNLVQQDLQRETSRLTSHDWSAIADWVEESGGDPRAIRKFAKNNFR